MLPAFVPAETERAELLQKLIEQIKFERTDGPQLPVRVIIDTSPDGQEVTSECFVEETKDSSTEFAYNDFLSMLHKRVRAKGVTGN